MDERSTERVDFLDGVRGWASFAVLLAHLIFGFASKEIPLLDFDSARLNSAIQSLNIPDLILGMSLIFFANGTLAVMIFFVLSGYVLTCRQLDPVKRNLAFATSTRYFRLMLPILLTSLFAYALLKFGLMFNQEVAKLDGRYANWLGSFYNFDASFIKVVGFSIVDVFFNYNSDASYNPVLWTMSYELMGSFLVFAFLGIFKATQKVNWMVLLIAILFFFVIAPNYACFFLGYGLAELEKSDYRSNVQAKLGHRNFEIANLLLFVFVFVLSTPFRTSFHANVILATIFIYACLNCGLLRSFFSNGPSKFLGRISFPLYLLQVPIICSLSSWIHLTLRSQNMDGQLAAIINFGVSMLACFCLAVLVLPMERLSIAFSKRVGRAIVS